MFVSRILAPYLFFCVAFAETPPVSWAYPQKLYGNPSTVTINIVDTIVAEWTANFQPAYLWVWCNIGTTSAPINDLWANFYVTNNKSWPFSPKDTGTYHKIQNWTQPVECHFDLIYQDVFEQKFNGPHFNITSVANQKAKTWSAPSSTGAPNTQSNSPSSTPTSSPITSSSAAQPTSSRNDKDGISTGTKAGIAIGAIAGSILLITLAFMVWRNKRRVGRHSDVQEAGASPQYGYKETYQHQTTTELESQAQIELEPRTAPQELHGSSVDVSERSREA